MYKKYICLRLDLLIIALACSAAFMLISPGLFAEKNEETIALPQVKQGSPGSFSDLMHRRRSVRSFAQGEVSLEQISGILFAAQGITRQDRYRTVPSAGALYPLEVYLLAGAVRGLDPGIYKYRPHGQRIMLVDSGDKRRLLAREALGQMWIAEAQTILVICAVYERLTRKYGQRGIRYTHIEAGCAAQNISLEGYDIKLGSTIFGANFLEKLKNLNGQQKIKFKIQDVGDWYSREIVSTGQTSFQFSKDKIGARIM